MAESFEPYHVPQQSRRDKLRVLAGQPDHPPGFFPFSYDPSSDLLTCDPNHPPSAVKEEGHALNHHFMGFRNHSYPYLDPHPSNHFALNPTSVQEINTNPFLYPPQNLRDFDHQAAGYGGAHDQVTTVVFKPEPLALSLSSSQHNHHQNNNSIHRYGSGSGSAVNYGSVNVGSGSDDLARSLGPLGPFTGYASILKGSRFLKPAQQLLEEFCDVGNREIYGARVLMSAGDDSASFFEPPVESLTADDDALSAGDGGESRRKKSRLISMLDEVYRRYKQYYQQMQAVVTSFEYVAGLGNAAPYANLAIKAMTKHFKILKNAITEQLQLRNKDATHLSNGSGKDETQLRRNSQNVYSQRPIHSSELVEHQPVWRPQRGLPERSVTVLRAWLFEHFLHPYPSDSEKLMLAKQTGLSRSQVSNWFINARVRLWKPMVEEIHTLETRQAQKGSERVDQNPNRSSDYEHLPSPNSLASDNPSTSTTKVQDTGSKRTRNQLPDLVTIASTQPMNLSYNTLPSMHMSHVGMSNMVGGSSTSGVSLTLGLHQNNGHIGHFSEPIPMNAAQRFGLALDGSSERYAMGGFEAQNRHFGRDVMGGQLLHDFVG